MSEHRVIEQVLDCLDAIAAQAARGGNIDCADARDAVAFLRGFADACHHGKEEALLFPLMEQRGIPPENGPTSVMRHEHEAGRAHVRAMANALDKTDAGDGDAARTFVAHAQAFSELLRQHIAKEDHCLFGMADQLLSEVDEQHPMVEFEQAEAANDNPHAHEEFVAVARRLAGKYGVKVRDAAAAGCCGHSHHGA